MRVHQMTTGLSYGDAITNHIFAIDRRLKAWGLESRVFATYIEERLGNVAQLDSEYVPFMAHPDDLLVYHYSIYSPNLSLYERSSNRKIVVYHNITPPEFFHGYDAALEADCRRGREALPRLADCDLGVGDSDYNRRELVAVGVPAERTAVLPIFLDLAGLRRTPLNQALYDRVRGSGRVNLLFVSRLVPSKACEDLLKILAAYRAALDDRVHLWLAGRPLIPRYQTYLARLTERLGLTEYVTFTDRVSLSDLCTLYAAADVYLCASRHEGFSVPLLESMTFDLPILAYNTAAVPDTLGTAGVLFNAFDYPVLAATARTLATDADLRRAVVAGQRQRLADFAPERVEAELRGILARVGVRV